MTAHLMCPPKLFFFHLPKAGGTSLRAAFLATFPGSRLCPLFDNDVGAHRALKGRYSNYRGFDIYAGHYGRDVYEQVTDGHSCITNFRHPVTRVLSLYNYFRATASSLDLKQNDPAYRAIVVAKQETFQGFVTSNDPYVDIYIRNAHVRQLTGSPWSLEPSGDLPAARAFVDTMLFYLICERVAESEAWARSALGLSRIPVENATTQLSAEPLLAEVDSLTADIICEKNHLDLALYDHAIRRFATAARGAAIPPLRPEAAR